MTLTTGRIGGAIGLALSGAIMTFALAARGLTPRQIEAPDSWTT
jgi:hypothetical protein